MRFLQVDVLEERLHSPHLRTIQTPLQGFSKAPYLPYVRSPPFLSATRIRPWLQPSSWTGSFPVPPPDWSISRSPPTTFSRSLLLMRSRPALHYCAYFAEGLAPFLSASLHPLAFSFELSLSLSAPRFPTLSCSSMGVFVFHDPPPSSRIRHLPPNRLAPPFSICSPFFLGPLLRLRPRSRPERPPPPYILRGPRFSALSFDFFTPPTALVHDDNKPSVSSLSYPLVGHDMGPINSICKSFYCLFAQGFSDEFVASFLRLGNVSVPYFTE